MIEGCADTPALFACRDKPRIVDAMKLAMEVAEMRGKKADLERKLEIVSLEASRPLK